VDHTVRRNGHNIERSPKEFALLESCAASGQAVTRTAIVGAGVEAQFRYDDECGGLYINYLRRKWIRVNDHALSERCEVLGYQIGGNGAKV